tara:strand:- start:821 stop:1243 length:423 start_codon:yes stop_codon:yes gene_type:complete
MTNKVIYTDGIFDLFHRGHIEYLNLIKKTYPDCKLYVGIINDEDSTKYKRKPIYSHEDRVTIISNLKCTDFVIQNAPLVVNDNFLNLYKIDLVVHGFSNKKDIENQKHFFEIPVKLNKFASIPYYNKISTTDIIEKIKKL